MADVRLEVADRIATITLDRPDALNALTIGMKGELLAAFRSVARDREVRAVVLTGAGRAFCAGQDLKERLEPDATPLAVEVRERYNPIIRAMRELDQPIVGAINGVAAGAGASLAFACDLRVAAETATFTLAFGRIGLVPDSGATWFLPRLVGSGQGRRDWRCCPTRCRPPRRSGWGLVARVVPVGDVVTEARAMAAAAGGAAPRAPWRSRSTRSTGRGARTWRPAWRTRRTSRASPARPRITPRAWPPSWRSGRRGSPGSRAGEADSVSARHRSEMLPRKRNHQSGRSGRSGQSGRSGRSGRG